MDETCLVKLFKNKEVSVVKDPNDVTVIWFKANDIAAILDMKNIISSIQNFDEDEKQLIEINTNKGMQKAMFLSSTGLYRLLNYSRKPIAKEFRKWAARILNDIIFNDGLNVSKELEEMRRDKQEKEDQNRRLTENMKTHRQDILLNQYNDGKNIVYIIKVKDNDDGSYIVKIGESRRGIRDRFNEHNANYGGVLLLDCYEVEKSNDFEKYIHERLKNHRVNDLKGHEKAQELFLVGKELTYKMITDIINANIHRYRDIWKEYQKLQLEHSILKEKKCNELLTSREVESNTDVVVPNLTELLSYIKLQNEELKQYFDEKMQAKDFLIQQLISEIQAPKKTMTNFNEPNLTLGPYVQKINPESMTLVKAYDSVADAKRQIGPIICKSSLTKAIKENTIYRGFRWIYVAREDDPNILGHVEPTKITRGQNMGYVAKLDINKTRIVNVYLDRKTAAKLNGCATTSRLDTIVINKKLFDDHYYVMYDRCEENLMSDYERLHGVPVLYKAGVGKFDSDDVLVQEFECKYHCSQQPDISDKTLTKALDTGKPYNNFIYKHMGEKLSHQQ